MIQFFSSGDCSWWSNSRFQVIHLSCPDSKFSHFIAPSKSLQGFNSGSLQPPILLHNHFSLPEFFMEALHGGSSRILFILHLFFKASLEVMIRQAILKNKHGAQHMLFLRSSSILLLAFLKCNYFYLIFWGGVISFLTISFMFLDSHVVKNEVV